MLKSCTFFALLTVILYSTLAAQDVQFLMSKGDSSYHAYNNEVALEYFTKVLEMDENNYDASWKLARAYVDVGETKQDKEERKAFYKKGEEFARKAVEIDSNGAKGHLFLSIAIGLQSSASCESAKGCHTRPPGELIRFPRDSFIGSSDSLFGSKIRPVSTHF